MLFLFGCLTFTFLCRLLIRLPVTVLSISLFLLLQFFDLPIQSPIVQYRLLVLLLHLLQLSLLLFGGIQLSLNLGLLLLHNTTIFHLSVHRLNLGLLFPPIALDFFNKIDELLLIHLLEVVERGTLCVRGPFEGVIVVFLDVDGVFCLDYVEECIEVVASFQVTEGSFEEWSHQGSVDAVRVTISQHIQNKVSSPGDLIALKVKPSHVPQLVLHESYEAWILLQRQQIEAEVNQLQISAFAHQFSQGLDLVIWQVELFESSGGQEAERRQVVVACFEDLQVVGQLFHEGNDIVLNILCYPPLTMYLRSLRCPRSPNSVNLFADMSKQTNPVNSPNSDERDRKLTLTDNFLMFQQYLATSPSDLRQLLSRYSYCRSMALSTEGMMSTLETLRLERCRTPWVFLGQRRRVCSSSFIRLQKGRDIITTVGV